MVSSAQRVQTPMMKQYLALKAQVPDALLFFRLGDFYELFLEDAERAAPLLDLVLTTRDRDAEDPVPMCGVPVHAAEGYIRRLLDAGHRVAIGEQVEDARLAKGLVRREIVEVISPGLVADASRLADSGANYLAALVRDGAGFGFAYLDVSTGEFVATSTSERVVLDAELARTAPRELVVRGADKDLAGALPLRVLPDADFDPAGAARRVGRVPQGFEARADEPALRAAAALWITAAECQAAALASVEVLRRYQASERMVLDPSTRAHLELVRNARDGSLRGTLLEVIDRTRTPMGRRLLVQRIGEPLLDAAAIAARQEELARWLEPDSRRARLREALRGVGDLERILTRLVLPGCGPRELATLRAALGATLAVHEIDPFPDAEQRALAEVRAVLERGLVDDPPMAPRGEPHVGYIRDGVDPDVDAVRSTADQGHAATTASSATRSSSRARRPSARPRSTGASRPPRTRSASPPRSCCTGKASCSARARAPPRPRRRCSSSCARPRSSAAQSCVQPRAAWPRSTSRRVSPTWRARGSTSGRSSTRHVGCASRPAAIRSPSSSRARASSRTTSRWTPRKPAS
jgi:DNA mismatch repair protein MutS